MTSPSPLGPPARQNDIAAVIDGYVPGGVDAAVWHTVGDEVRRWVRAANPGHRRRALQLLYASAHLAAWCSARRVPAVAASALRDTSIEQFCAWAERQDRFSATTRSTIRARLRHVAAANAVPGNRPAPPALPRGRIRPPYTAAQIRSYLQLARTQRDPDRRRRLTGLVTAGAGAGCAPEDFRNLRGGDITREGSTVWVRVTGNRPRRVPVIAALADPLMWAAQRSGDRLLVGGIKPNRRSVTTTLLHRIDGGLDLPALEPGRLRSTWLAYHLVAGVRLDVVMAAAGLSTPTTIVDLVALLPAPSPDAWQALVDGTRR